MLLWLCPLSAVVWRFHQFKQGISMGSAIPVATHSGHQINLGLIDLTMLVKYGLVDVHFEHFTDYQVAGTAVLTKFYHFLHFAFQLNRTFFYSGRFYQI